MKNTRTKQRFENFSKAFLLLKTGMGKNANKLSDLEKEGIIQRFEYTFELAWKTLGDYLEYSGYTIDEKTPRNIIKIAFNANIIRDGEEWINMLANRNIMSHQYNFSQLEKVINDLENTHLKILEDFYNFLEKKLNG